MFLAQKNGVVQEKPAELPAKTFPPINPAMFLAQKNDVVQEKPAELPAKTFAPINPALWEYCAPDEITHYAYEGESMFE